MTLARTKHGSAAASGLSARRAGIASSRGISLGVEGLESRQLLAVYHVSTDGQDGAAGTLTNPWQTLQYAADRVVAGDSVLVAPGSYVGFDLRTSGRSDARITFQAADATALPVINQRNARTPDGINLEGASYVTIDGFQVQNLPRTGIRSVTNERVEIRNNILQDNGTWGILTGFSDDVLIERNQATGSIREHGIYVSNSGDRPVIRFNRIWNNRANGIHMNADVTLGGDGLITGALVEGNVIFENGRGGGSGINAAGVQYSRFVNNLLYDNHASGISLYQGEGAAGSAHNVVANNTVLQPADGRWALNITQGSSHNVVFNNILLSQHPFRGSITISQDSLPGFYSNQNILADRMSVDDGGSRISLAAWQSQTKQDAQSFLATREELFVDPVGKDFHLKPGSLALGKGLLAGPGGTGLDVSAPNKDFEGDLRPAAVAPDLGADQRPGPTTLPGDFNRDGRVDIVDFILFRPAFGTLPVQQEFDLNADGVVDLGDFIIFRNHFGRSGP